jgi:hypothetical protein
MGQGNVFYPLIPYGLHWGNAIIISIFGGLVAAAVTYHLFGKNFPAPFRTRHLPKRLTINHRPV